MARRLLERSAVRTLAASRLSLRALALAVALPACGTRADRGTESPDGSVSEIEANRRVREAIRRSSEGVILMPSRKAERMFELPRLNELAQNMRQPFAVCFLRRAIVTMQSRPGSADYEGVPEGQAKIRARIAPSGEVVRAEVLETGFHDEAMEACLTSVVEDQKWPENQSGNVHYVDVVYWVSLGAQRDRDTATFRQHVRRESLAAGVRAKPCLQGRVDSGSYAVDGLNLVDREGGTLVNRVEQGALPEPIRACIARAFRDIRLARDPDSFVRPIAPKVEFRIDRDGTIAVVGEEWLRLVELEEEARRAQERAAMTGELEGDARPGGPPIPSVGLVDEGEPELPRGDAPAEAVEPEPEPVDPEPVATPKEDPGQGGLRLDLGGRRRP
jgi:hypothetical protein